MIHLMGELIVDLDLLQVYESLVSYNVKCYDEFFDN